MIIIQIAVIVLAVFASWMMSEKDAYGRRDYWSMAFGAILGGIIGLVLGVVFAFMVGSILPKHPSSYGRQELVALRNVNGFEGSFFLLAGSIDDEYKYSYWYEDQGGGYKRDEINDSQNEIVIFEDALAENAYLQENWQICDEQISLWGICVSSFDGYEFHIPPGSIVRQFQLQ